MVSPFPRLLTQARTPRQPMTWTGEDIPAPPAVRPDQVSHRQPARPAPATASERLRCLWYGACLAEAMTVVDEFLRTPAATAALVEFYRARYGSPAPEFDTRALIDMCGVTAARLRA
jgi:hypothetical protein